MNSLDPVLLILLGWALGLFTPRITEALRRPSKARDLRQCLFTELRELQHTMVAVAYRAGQHLGTLDQELLTWALPLYENYTGPGMEPRILDALRALKAIPSAQFQAAVQVQKAPPGRGLSMKTYDLPFLESQVQSLSLLPTSLQQALLRLRSRLNYFNEDVRFLMQQHQLTFDSSLTAANHQAVVQSLDDGYAKLSRLARSLADDIEEAVRL